MQKGIYKEDFERGERMKRLSERIEMPLWNGMVLYAFLQGDKKLKRKLLKAIEKGFEGVKE